MRLPEDNLCYPMSLQVGNSLGTAFLYGGSGSPSVLVTARHCLFDEAGKLLAPTARVEAQPGGAKYPARGVFSMDLAAIEAAGRLKTDAARDVAVVDFAKPRPDVHAEGVEPTLGITRIGSDMVRTIAVHQNSTRSFADVRVGNEAFVLGYPASIGLKNVPQIDFSRPLVRAGSIAGKNDAARTIILDCAVYPGNSGGPVVEREEEGVGTYFRVIGVVLQYVPIVTETYDATGKTIIGGHLANSGYSVVASMDTVLELVRQL